MAKPLIISDCDEVLMHMVVPFGAWVDAEHDLHFRIEDTGFANALRKKACGTPLEPAQVWPLLDGFFRNAMHLQYAIPGARDAMARVAELADIVILTNVGPEHAAARTRQLHEAGMPYRVVGSRGGKGEPVARLLDDVSPSMAVFIDDLPQHHTSVAREAPDVWRLHMVGEPAIADKIPAAPDAHARIDDWELAERWLMEKLGAGHGAPHNAKDDA